MNKKLLRIIARFILLIVSLMIVFSFVKYQAIYLPVGWAGSDGVSICMCANCSLEDCGGSQHTGKPFLEHYIKGDTENINSLAVHLNLYIIYYLMIITVALGTVGLAFWIAKRRRG